MLYIIGGLNTTSREQNYYVNVTDKETQLDVRLLSHLNGPSVIKGCVYQKVRATSLGYIEKQLQKYPDKANYSIEYNGVGISEEKLCSETQGYQLLHLILTPKTYKDRYPFIKSTNQKEEVGQVLYQIYSLLLLSYNQGLYGQGLPINKQKWVLKGFKIQPQEIHIFISCQMSTESPSYAKFAQRWFKWLTSATIQHLFYIDENDLMKDLQKCRSEMLRKVIFNGLRMNYSIVTPQQVKKIIPSI